MVNTSVASNRPVSRIENDVETVKRLAERIEGITERIIRNARALGYFEAAKDASQGATPVPVITTLADALIALDRAVDHCSGSLNVYD